MAFIKLTALLFIGITVHGCFADAPEPIVGGRRAYDGEFPFYASVRFYGEAFCGGAIISESHILTATHCVEKYRYPYTGLTIATGSVWRARGQSHQIRNITNHPNFIRREDKSLVNDISVITLERPIKMNNYQKPITVASSEVAPGSVAVIIGLGRRYSKGPVPNVLITGKEIVLSTDDCQMLLYPRIDKRQLCAITPGTDAVCNGDSGGPIVYGNELIGLTSWTQGTCGNGSPDISTKVMYYHDFINEVVSYQG